MWNRVLEKTYRRSHPNDPWLAPAADDFLAGYLQKTDIGLEFGSGRSTIWFSKRVTHLTSAEHQEEWYRLVQKRLQEMQAENVAYGLYPKIAGDPTGKNSAYVKITDTIPKESLDFVLVDGAYRAQCTLHSIPLLKPRGILIIDNVNKYLPSSSAAPNSRSFSQGPIDDDWAQILSLIQPWRKFWTGNGVSDTSIYFKPAA
jgi:hypothetical protein